MGKLPNCENAIVSERKLLNYLLDPMHEEGESKAKFFERFGFKSENWAKMADALLQLACSGEVAEIKTTQYGMVYRLEGFLKTPDNRDPGLTTIWMIDIGGVRHTVNQCISKQKNHEPMIKEFDYAVLTVDLPEYNLLAGDRGVVVDIIAGGEAYFLEFITALGDTFAVVLVEASQVRAQSKRDVVQVRELAEAA